MKRLRIINNLVLVMFFIVLIIGDFNAVKAKETDINNLQVKILNTNYLEFKVKNLIGDDYVTIEPSTEEILTFKDKKLESGIRREINKLDGNIYKSDVKEITGLDCSNYGIKDLTGIEKLTNLQDVNLSNNEISNISSLKSLPKLQYLNLSSNQISDISALKDLTKLENLDLYSNQISDISALKDLTKLQNLNLGSNQIRDISAVKDLTNLISIGLQSNQISDISVLKTLPNLYFINLSYNEIRDISVLKNLINLFDISLSNNQISDISVLKNLTSLYDISLSNNQISDISALKDLTKLQNLNLSNNEISDISVLKDLTSLQGLNLSNNEISDISALKDLTNIGNLDLSNNEIKDISALKTLAHLYIISLAYNEINDISGLKDLTNIGRLDLSNNEIIDISGLKGLTNLEDLNLSNNEIIDISELKALTNIGRLDLSKNEISDISVLKYLTNLYDISLSNNKIRDISILKSISNLYSSKFVNLYSINLSYNEISDITVLQYLTSLDSLDLSNNEIRTISALRTLTNLDYLWLADNHISDYTPVKSYYEQLKEKDFELPTDTSFEKLKADYKALELGDLSAVTSDLKLPTKGDNKSTITWESDNTSVISNKGKVTRPEPGQKDAKVKLTATITLGKSKIKKAFKITVKSQEFTDEYSVAKDKETLNLGNINSIEKDLTLPASGANGTTITWSSNNKDVVTDDGKVTRPEIGEEDVQVVLTATIAKGEVKDTKTFDLTVKAQAMTDEYIVSKDKEALDLGDTSAVTSNLTLPSTGANGATITWKSSNSKVIGNKGKVTRPAMGQPDAVVTLTATIKKGKATDTKIFEVLVKAQPMTDAYIVKSDKDSLKLESSVENDLDLPVTGVKGSTITWSSSNTNVLGNDGTVTRPEPGQKDITVTLTATITKGDESVTKIFKVKVKALPITDMYIVERDYAALDLGDLSAITNDFKLPTKGKNGSKISWESNNCDLISAKGKVLRPVFQGDVMVDLTATIINGKASEKKIFTVTIKEREATDADYTALAKSELNIGDITAVTEDLELPKTWGDTGVTITWKSSNTSVLGHDGKVLRPAVGKRDTLVNLTATISKGKSKVTNVFKVVVKALE